MELELSPAERPRLVRVVRPYSRNGKVYSFDVFDMAGVPVSHTRFKFRYVVEYMPRLRCHRVKRMVKQEKYPLHSPLFAEYVMLATRFNKHVDTPSMSDAMAELELMMSEEVAGW